MQAVLPGITLDEVTAMARARLSGATRVVLAVSPQKQEIKPPSEADLVAALGSAENVAVMPWNDRAAPTELMADKPAPAAVTERREIAERGRHRRAVRQRRRSMAEADRFQERSSAVHDVRPRRRFPRRADRLRRGLARHVVHRAVRSRRPENAGSATSSWPASWRRLRRSSRCPPMASRDRPRQQTSRPRCSCCTRWSSSLATTPRPSS